MHNLSDNYSPDFQALLPLYFFPLTKMCPETTRQLRIAVMDFNNFLLLIGYLIPVKANVKSIQ